MFLIKSFIKILSEMLEVKKNLLDEYKIEKKRMMGGI